MALNFLKNAPGNLSGFFIRYKPALLTLLVLAGGYYYYLYVIVSDNEAALKERSFRGLHRMAENISGKLAEYKTKNATNFLRAVAADPGDSARLEKDYGLGLLPLGKTDTFPNEVDEHKGRKLFFTDDNKDNKDVAYADPYVFVQPFIRRDLFDYFFLTHGNTILFDELKIGKGLIDGRLTTKNEDDTTKDGIKQVGGFQDVNVAGRDYKLFSLAFPGSGDKVYTLGALMPADRYEAEKRYIPTYAILWMIAGLLLVLLTFPLLKIFLMKGSEQLTAQNAIAAMAALHVLAAVAVLIAVNVYVYFTLIVPKADLTLKNLAYQTKSLFLAEVDAALQEIDSIESVMTFPKGITGDTVRPPVDTAKPRFALPDVFASHTPPPGALVFPALPAKDTGLVQFTFRVLNDTGGKGAPYQPGRIYPHFRNVAWVNGNGQQRFVRTTQPDFPKPINVSDRDYFKAVKNGELWWRDNDSFYLAVVASWISQAKLVVVSKRSLLAHAGGADDSVLMVNLAAPFRSVYNAVLPEGYGFSMVRDSGEVVFHSEKNRGLSENLLAECSNREAIKALLSTRSDGYAGTQYAGGSQRLFVTPVDGLPFTIITFRDMRILWSEDLDVISACSILCLLNLAVILLAILIIQASGYRHSLLQNQSILFTWLRPAKALAPAYQSVAAFSILSIVLQAVALFAYTGHDRLCLIGISFFYSFILLAYMYYQFAVEPYRSSPANSSKDDKNKEAKNTEETTDKPVEGPPPSSGNGEAGQSNGMDEAPNAPAVPAAATPSPRQRLAAPFLTLWARWYEAKKKSGVVNLIKHENERRRNERPLWTLCTVYLVAATLFTVNLHSGEWFFVLFQVSFLLFGFFFTFSPLLNRLIVLQRNFRWWYSSTLFGFVAATAITPIVIYFLLCYKEERLLSLKHAQLAFANRLAQEPPDKLSFPYRRMVVDHAHPYHFESFASAVNATTEPGEAPPDSTDGFEELYKTVKPAFSPHSREIEFFIRNRRSGSGDFHWHQVDSTKSIHMDYRMPGTAGVTASRGLSIESRLDLWQETSESVAAYWPNTLLMLTALVLLLLGFIALLNYVIRRTFFDGYVDPKGIKETDLPLLKDLPQGENLFIVGPINSGKHNKTLELLEKEKIEPIEKDLANLAITDLKATDVPAADAAADVNPKDISTVDAMAAGIAKAVAAAREKGCAKVAVVLRHFEFCMHDETERKKKLALLEHLLTKEEQIIILSSRSVEALHPARAGAGEEDKSSADRWGNALNQFYNLSHHWQRPDEGLEVEKKLKDRKEDLIKELWKKGKEKMNTDWEKNFRGNPKPGWYGEIEIFLLERIQYLLWRVEEQECMHSDFLWSLRLALFNYLENEKIQPQLLGFEIRYANRRHIREQISLHFTRQFEEVCLKIQSLAANYYLTLWQSLNREEQQTLLDIGMDDMVNPANRGVALRLANMGLIRPEENIACYGLMNTSFRNFVFTQLDKAELKDLQTDASGAGTWRSFELPVLTVVLGLAIFLFTTQQTAFTDMVTYLGAAIGGIAGLLKVLGMIPSTDT